MELIKKEDYGDFIHFTLVDDINESPVLVTEINVRQCTPAQWVREAVNASPQKQFLYLSCFGTKKALWRRGYGRKMLQYIKDHYPEHVLFLEVNSCGDMTNKQLKAFYESEGFREI